MSIRFNGSRETRKSIIHCFFKCPSKYSRHAMPLFMQASHCPGMGTRWPHKIYNFVQIITPKSLAVSQLPKQIAIFKKVTRCPTSHTMAPNLHIKTKSRHDLYCDFHPEVKRRLHEGHTMGTRWFRTDCTMIIRKYCIKFSIRPWEIQLLIGTY